MANILIIGAGSMGTAFAFPCSDNNHNVNIIGTHLENDFIEKIKGGDLNNAIVLVESELSEEESKKLGQLFGKDKVEVQKQGILNNLDLYYLMLTQHYNY